MLDALEAGAFIAFLAYVFGAPGGLFGRRCPTADDEAEDEAEDEGVDAGDEVRDALLTRICGRCKNEFRGTRWGGARIDWEYVCSEECERVAAMRLAKGDRIRPHRFRIFRDD